MYTFESKKRAAGVHAPALKKPVPHEASFRAGEDINSAGPPFDFARIPIGPPAPVQRSEAAGSSAVTDEGVRDAARLGTSGPGGTLPHLSAIQRSFGRHVVSGTKAHLDENAQEGSRAMGANAFATGGHVAFARSPSLRTAAHEAAHVVQQQAGVRLEGGVGRAGDPYEQHANAVAEQVVKGQSSETLLDASAGGAPAGPSSAPAIQRDEYRPKDLKNDSWKGDDTGPLALPGTKFTSDPYDHTVVVVHADGTAVQYTYEIVQTDSGPREKLYHTEPLSPARLKAIERMDKVGGGENQEGKAGPAARKKADEAAGKKLRDEWATANPAAFKTYQDALAAYQTMVTALPEDQKKKPPPPPPAPKGYNPDKKTTLCTNWPGEVYRSAGGDADQKFDFTPPKTLPSWRTLDKNPNGPKPGDVYWLWDITNKWVAHMGIFKSSTPEPGHPELSRWVVVDGGQGKYTEINTVNQRSRLFDPKTGKFSSNIAEAGQDKGDRLLIGWVDIEAQMAAPKPAPQAPKAKKP